MIAPPKNFIAEEVISKHTTVKGKFSISASLPPMMRYVPVTWQNIFNKYILNGKHKRFFYYFDFKMTLSVEFFELLSFKIIIILLLFSLHLF